MDLIEAKTREFAAGARHPWERARLAVVSRLIARQVSLRSGDAVLDIGCGDSFVVDRLARAYPAVQFFAIDSAFSDELIQTYRARLTTSNVSLFRSLDDVPLDTPAALVLLMDVIEHVPDDVAFLADVSRRRWFGEATRLLITVPAYAALFCQHDRFLGHYRRYSRRALLALLAAVKLSAIEEGHLFASLLPVRVLQVLRERVQGAREVPTDVATWSGGESLARVLTSALTLDGRLGLGLARVGLRSPGLSVFAICQKTSA